ncbi:MAG: Protein disulfide oxidoreductase [Candidatus Curtissbacteria bacterium GW2011_GWA1_40_9]|uniref:Protein disulfide oxidoreductase n=1 Tax=Candidatus Curtissbacteria bacterium GW2011_GWA1_40_9 TaxID=1618408 RepID=A0A0G0TN05_9BACT|nr:MAG: Protein disulfide oxidoreductase [Candidatus Curtissbacteria bacterium GW2011_GWA1_40_9]
MKKLLKYLNKYVLHLALLQAWSATLGSLYFSEIRGLVPCLLCWYQRILMYPLLVIFTVAFIRKDKNVAYYALPMSLVGILISFYQYLLQMTPLGNVELTKCDLLNPCSKIDAIYLGFITIPFMSMIAFLVISSLMIYIIKTNKR